MKRNVRFWIGCSAALVVALNVAIALQGNTTPTRQQRFTPKGVPTVEDSPGAFEHQGLKVCPSPKITEAPTGFDNLTNGFTIQGPPFNTITEANVVPGRSFNDDRFVFEAVETYADGLGPTYNAQSCRECHQNVVTGGASQVAEFRTGLLNGDDFFESPGGTLIQSRATNAAIVEYVPQYDNTRTLRLSVNTLGDGFVECVADSTLTAIRDSQPVAMRGTALTVAVLEANGAARVGRFGWKDQHASLQSFSADAYLNEMGITNPLFMQENTSNGQFVGYGSGYDPLPEPEDNGTDVAAFTGFIRSTKAPARGPITSDVLAGQALFNQVGCATCHVPSIVTAIPGTKINGGTFTVPSALGNKIIHPYSDFLLHNIGSGDGIPVLPGEQYESTAYQIRTAPLWGLRTRNRLMHDGLSYTPGDAVTRHKGQAAAVVAAALALTPAQQAQLLAFLDSL